MIKLSAIGHLGRDATLNVVSGRSVIGFTVAHTERYKDQQGNQVDKTVWLDCSYWTEKTGIQPYLKKGTQVYLEGIPDSRAYTNKEGALASTLTVRVLSIQLIGSKAGDGSAESGTSYPSAATPVATAPSAPPSSYTSSPSSYAPVPPTPANEPMDDLPF